MNLENKKLNEVLGYEQPTKYIVETTDYDDSFKTPVLTAGKSFLLGYTDDKDGIFKNVPAIIFDDFTTSFHYVEFPFKVKSSAMKILTAKEDFVDLKYVYQQMKQVRIDTQLHKRYWISRFSNKEIPFPKIDIQNGNTKTQKHIAAILDDASALCDKTAQLIREYDLLAQSIFLEMFGDPGMNDKKENFTELKKLIAQKPDNGFFAKKEFYATNGTPIIWLNNFIDKLYIEQDGLRRAVILAKDEKYVLEYGDALFCRSSLTAEGIGKCAIVPKELNEKTLFECHIIRLKFNLGMVIPEYFRFLSDTRYFRANIEKRAKTSTMTTISQDGIIDIKIPVPPIKLQKQFAEKIALIEQQKALAKQELQESEDLFNCLLQKAFKGELV